MASALFSLLTTTAPTAPEETLGRGLTLLYMLALVGVLVVTLLLLAFSFRRTIHRKFTQDKQPKKDPSPDAWSESANRMPTPRPDALEDDEPGEDRLL